MPYLTRRAFLTGATAAPVLCRTAADPVTGKRGTPMLYDAHSFPGSIFIPAILGTVVFFYGGVVFIRGRWVSLRSCDS
jgi:hypothetical protein